MQRKRVEAFFMVIQVVPHSIFLFYWLYLVRIELLKMAHDYNKPRLFRFISCGQYSMLNFLSKLKKKTEGKEE